MNKLKLYFIYVLLEIGKNFRRVLSESEDAYALLFTPGYEGLRWRFGKWKALQVLEHAKKMTPAYKDFISLKKNSDVRFTGLDPDFTRIPVMDKESYIKKYSIESRCIYGRLPNKGVVIDESSGTSGTPNNWVRGPIERAAVKQAMQTALHYLIGDEPVFVINAFALGPWATGMNVSMSLVDVSILKSTGPDVKKIENTLNLFGPTYRYIIAGYPPFLKNLVDTANVDWKAFNCIAFYGGEGMSEGMRDYVGRAFKQVYGSYGASDLEINIAAENDFTIALRKKMASNKKLFSKIAKHSTLPMVFQYNPLDYYIESTKDGELLVTLCRKTNIAPKIRYNIHDRGHVMRFPELESILKSSGMSVSDIGEVQTDLPLLFHYGRADMAVGFYGCKITPAEIEEIIFKNSELAKSVNSFTLVTAEDENLNKTLTLALEMNEGLSPLQNIEAHRQTIFDELKQMNQDFRESASMVPKGAEPRLEIFAFDAGPFEGQDIRLKRKYIQ